MIEELEEDPENEYIEAALYASGYFREDVPLDGDTQAFLRAACEETGKRFLGTKIVDGVEVDVFG